MSWDQAFLLYKARGNRYPRDGFWLKKKPWFGKPEIVLALTAPGTDELEMEIYRPNMGQVNNVPRFEFIHENTRIDDKDPGWWIGSKAKEAFLYTTTPNSVADTTGDAKPSDLVENAFGAVEREMLHHQRRRRDHVERTSICFDKKPIDGLFD